MTGRPPPTLSIIVPTYRDGSRIYRNLIKLDQALATIGEPYIVNCQASMSILQETAAVSYRKNVLCYYDVPHMPISVDALSALTDAELSRTANEQPIAGNVLCGSSVAVPG
jgi:hypothetical protein